MADATFSPTPRPVRIDADRQPYPTCPCGEQQAVAPSWHGWRTCPCGGATGEITSLGTAHWRLHDRPLVEQRRAARCARIEAEIPDRVRAKIG